MRAIIVDDDPDILNLYKKYLAGYGLDIDVCLSAEEAVALIEKKSCEFMIIDWGLPKMSGLSLCRWVRGRPHGDVPYILMITVKKGPKHLKELLDAGSDDYLAKPFSLDSFQIRIKVALNDIHHRTRRREAEMLVDAMAERMRTVLDSLQIGAVLLDKNHKVLYSNDTAAYMTQQSLNNNIPFAECMPLTGDNKNILRRWLDTSGATGRLTLHLDLRTDRWLELETYPDVKDPRRRIIHMKDVTEAMEAKLSKSRRDEYNLTGQSWAASEMRRQIDLMADGEWNVLIEGETGTGKELAARALHNLSSRSEKTFLAVNCAGLTDTLASSILFGHKKGAFTGAVSDHKGFFEAAEGGTLFLDEIGDISPSLQVMLLRALEQKEITRVGENTPRRVDVRILTATNKNLAREVEQGHFRADLFYRLNSARLVLPPLRERREDIPLLIEHFLYQYRRRYPELNSKVNSEAMKILMNYPWPGNIRELKSVIQFAAVQAANGLITPEELPPDIVNPPQAKLDIVLKAGNDAQSIRNAITAAAGNRSKAASYMGVSRATFYRKMKKFNI